MEPTGKEDATMAMYMIDPQPERVPQVLLR